MHLDSDNDLQLNTVLMLDEAARSNARLTADTYLEGIPELVLEITASSATIDLGSKKREARRNVVQEYIVDSP